MHNQKEKKRKGKVYFFLKKQGKYITMLSHISAHERQQQPQQRMILTTSDNSQNLPVSQALGSISSTSVSQRSSTGSMMMMQPPCSPPPPRRRRSSRRSQIRHHHDVDDSVAPVMCATIPKQIEMQQQQQQQHACFKPNAFAEYFTTQVPGNQMIVNPGGYYPLSSAGPFRKGGFQISGAGPFANTLTVNTGGLYEIRFVIFPTLSRTGSAGVQLEVDGVRIPTAVAVRRLMDSVAELDDTLGNDAWAHLRDNATIRLINNTDCCVVLRQFNLVQLRIKTIPE